jgi:hypothetical protein
VTHGFPVVRYLCVPGPRGHGCSMPMRLLVLSSSLGDCAGVAQDLPQRDQNGAVALSGSGLL